MTKPTTTSSKPASPVARGGSDFAIALLDELHCLSGCGLQQEKGKKK